VRVCPSEGNPTEVPLSNRKTTREESTTEVPQEENSGQLPTQYVDIEQRPGEVVGRVYYWLVKSNLNGEGAWRINLVLCIAPTLLHRKMSQIEGVAR